jgi:TonB-dependent receptor
MLAALFFLVAGVSSAAAQDTGAIAGVVVDAANGETLPGANVSIEGTTTGTSTDLKGRYRITGLEPGSYDVLFSFVGFTQKTVTGVEVEAGETVKVDVSLQEQTAELDEVIVEAAAARDSEAGLLKKRAKAAALSNAISAELISRAGAGDVASAMSKVTGASIVEGKYVNVRGLQGRYVDVQLNGTTLPNADPEGNSVALDIFPSSLIDNVVTAKTFTPDQPGTFTGGAVDITTKSFPDDFFVNASVSSSFNTEVGLGGDFLRAPSGLDDVPAVADNGGIPTQPTSDPEGRQALNELTRSFATGVTPRSDDVLANRGAEFAVGNQFSVLGDRPLGFVASLTYDESFSGYRGGTTTRYSQTGLDAERLQAEADYTTQRGVEETLLGGLVGLSFQPTPKNELSVRFLYNRDEERLARFEFGSLPRDNITDDRGVQTRVSRVIERVVQSAEVDGSHQLGSGRNGVQVNWKAAYSEVSRDEPDNRFFPNETRELDSGETAYSFNKGGLGIPTRYFRDLTEDNWSGKASVEVPVGSARFEVGGKFRTRTREFRERVFKHEAPIGFGFSGNPDRYVDERAGLQQDDSFGSFVTEVPSQGGNYDADQSTGAGYLMLDTPVPGVSSLKFIGGARLEYTEMSLNTIGNTVVDEQGSFSQLDVLPSANLVWSLQESMNVRLAYGRTIALPSFREFSPFQSFSFIGDFTVEGNADLNRTTVNNLDLRWEWFPRPGELLSASIYYKDFNNAIERTFDTESVDQGIITFTNRDNATVYGIELEAQKRLGGLASWLEYFQVGGNLTLTQSEIDRTQEVIDLISQFRDDPSTTRQLQGQSPYIVNLSAGYNNPASGTSVNVFFNRFGDRIQTVSANGVDIFERGRSSLDVNASQQILQGVEVSLSVSNVLNTDEVVSQTFRGTEFINDERPLGRTVSVGISYRY